MKIRVLGCHGSDQVLDASRGSHQCRTCAFLVNDTVLVDAGTVGTALRLDEQRRIRHVLLSHLHRHWVRLSLKPFVVGMVHGLAGSAALMLMVVSTVRTVGEGLAYILVFGLGSVVGMMLLGVAISIPIVLSASCGRRAQEAVQALASLGSIGLGVTMLVRLGLGGLV